MISITLIIGMIAGMSTWSTRWNLLAPSIIAASCCTGSTLLRAAM